MNEVGAGGKMRTIKGDSVLARFQITVLKLHEFLAEDVVNSQVDKCSLSEREINRRCWIERVRANADTDVISSTRLFIIVDIEKTVVPEAIGCVISAALGKR